LKLALSRATTTNDPYSTGFMLAEAAAALGLEYVPSALEGRASRIGPLSRKMLTYRRMVGPIRSTQVRVLEHQSPLRHSLLYAIAFPPAGLPYRIQRQTPAQRLAGLLPGCGRPGTGDASFDTVLRLRRGDPAAVSARLNTDTRHALVRLALRVLDLYITDGRIDGTERRSSFRPATADEIVSTVRLFVEAAEHLSG
jgi:hypothetical protein